MTVGQSECETPSRTPNIYIFITMEYSMSSATTIYSGVAVDESGAVITNHTSSSIEWFKHDMGIGSHINKHDLYKKRHPDGYNLVFLEKGNPFIDNLMRFGNSENQIDHNDEYP